MNIIFMGPAGSGKGTQAVLLSKFLKIPHISVGSLLKKEIKQLTEFGKKTQEFIKEGKMVPDDLVIPFLKQRIDEKDCDKGFILDGFPRNLKQAVFLDKELEKIGKKIDKVFVIDISNDTVLKRTIGRFKCHKCGMRYNKFFKKPKVENKCDVCGSDDFVKRIDDLDEKIIRERIDIYEKETKRAIEYYKEKGLILILEGVKTIEEINAEIIAEMRNNFKTYFE
jgi:adenylate kinase